MRVAFYTFGCKVNQCETEALASTYYKGGFEIVSPDEPADLYIFNTCTVTTKSEQKARRLIRKTLRENRDTVICLIGCYAELNPEDLAALSPNVVTFPNDKKGKLARLPDLLRTSGHMETQFSLPEVLIKLRDADAYTVSGDKTEDHFNYLNETEPGRSRPFIKIQDGCDNRCAYCRVPLARGGSVSRDPDEIASRIGTFEKSGFGEVVVTGVNISSYRYIRGKTAFNLGSLVRHILEETDTIRIRLSSLEPDMFDDSLFDVLGEARVRPHVHLPVQSGSDAVLKLMRRKYLTDTVYRVVERIRQVKNNPFIAADFIVGFPGEDEHGFEETEALIRELGFSQLHVFQFSPRPGTAAVSMKNRVPERIAGQRSRSLTRLSEELFGNYLKEWNGKKVEAVAEKWTGPGPLQLVTENYIKAAAGSDELTALQPGQVCSVTLKMNDTGVFVF